MAISHDGNVDGDGMEPAFGVLLRRYRRAARLTQEALAHRALLSVQAISALERGVRTRPRYKTMMLLADALKLTDQQRDALITAAAPRDGSSSPLPPPSPPAANAAPPRQLLAAIMDFTGRAQQLAALMRMLTRPPDQTQGAVQVVAITGMAGIGKTKS